MSTIKKAIKTGLVAGLCGIGLCALGKKLGVPERVADKGQSVGTVSLPITRVYSIIASGHLKPLYEAVAKQITSAGHFSKILDMGTGLGYLPINLAKTSPNSCVYGIDESANMVRLAKNAARNARVEGCVELSSGDYENLPFPGRYFDFAVSVNALHHWKSPVSVLEEVYHILLPGGQFWIYDYRSDVPEELWEEMGKRLPSALRTMLLFGPVASSRAAFSDEEIEKFVKQTHFDEMKIEKVSLPLFGKSTPAFNLIKLGKPEQAE